MFVSLWSIKDVSAAGAGAINYDFEVEELPPELRYLSFQTPDTFGGNSCTILGRKIKASLKEYFWKELLKIRGPNADEYIKRKMDFNGFADYAEQKNREDNNRTRNIKSIMASIEKIQKDTVYNITVKEDSA